MVGHNHGKLIHKFLFKWRKLELTRIRVKGFVLPNKLDLHVVSRQSLDVQQVVFLVRVVDDDKGELLELG